MLYKPSSLLTNSRTTIWNTSLKKIWISGSNQEHNRKQKSHITSYIQEKIISVECTNTHDPSLNTEQTHKDFYHHYPWRQNTYTWKWKVETKPSIVVIMGEGKIFFYIFFFFFEEKALCEGSTFSLAANPTELKPALQVRTKSCQKDLAKISLSFIVSF